MWKKWNSLNLSVQIIICVIIGFLIGVFAGEELSILSPLGDMFIKAIQMMVILIIVPSIVSGFCSVDNPAQLGKTGVKIIAVFAFMYVLAATVAIVLVNLFKPGVGMQIVIPEGYTYEPVSQTFLQLLSSIVPKNPVQAFADGNLLQILFVSVLLACCTTLIKDKVPAVVTFFDQLNSVIMKMLSAIMRVSPYAAGLLMAIAIGVNGPAILGDLAIFILIMYVGQFLLAFCNVLVVGAAGMNMVAYFRRVLEPAIIAFTTRSSLAALPANIECVTDLGVPRGIGTFGVTIGNTINMGGTSFYQAVCVVFIAQAYGIEMSLTQQIIAALSAAVLCVSLVGIPGGGLASLGVLLAGAGLPPEGVGLIIAVDAIVDMPRTLNNVFGDASATIIASKLDGLIAADSPLLRRKYKK